MTRRRSLPIAPPGPPAVRNRPLEVRARAADAVRPTYAVWEITLKCDLACRHCGSRAGHARPDELSRAEALDLAHQIADLGLDSITLIGGEAYLREDWLEIAATLIERGVETSVTTGGRGIDRARAEAMAEVGISTVSVSVDGLQATHDHLRAVRGSHAAALGALEALGRAGVPVSVNTQICATNLREVESLFDVIAPLGVHSWQVQLTVAMGRAADDPDLLLQPWQMLEVMPMVARMQQRCDQAGVIFWPGTNIGYFGPYESLLRRDEQGMHTAACGAGRDTLGIEANGDIKGCPSLPTAAYTGGNIRDHALLDIWERSSALRFTRERPVTELWGYCGTCYYKQECMSGCTWTGHVLTGKRGNNPYCHHRALELLREGDRERLVPKTAAPNEPFDHATFEIVREPWPNGMLRDAKALAKAQPGDAARWIRSRSEPTD
ncbi:MAG: radical SAM protein [Nannocystaceae bacterium]|nr:radical SAM protein [Nannocystaceae bacterium]